MRLAHLALLFCCISIPAYFIGWQSPFQVLIGTLGTSWSLSDLIGLIASNMLNIALAAGIVGLALAVTMLTGFSAIYLVAALMLAVLVNYVLIPTQEFAIGGCGTIAAGAGAICVPDPVSITVRVVLNLVVLLAFAEYISGGR